MLRMCAGPIASYRPVRYSFIPSPSISTRSPAAKIDFAEAVRAEGIDLNPHYKYVVCEWPYIRPYLADDFDTPNARSIRDRSFNLYLNEKYGEQESKDCVKAIVKVEKHFKAG